MSSSRGMGILREAYYNNLLPRVAAALAGAGTALGLVQLAVPDLADFVPWPWWLAAGGLVILVATLTSFPRGSQTYTYEQGGWTIELVRGSILDYPHNSVLTSDRSGSTKLSVVGTGSLIGQAIRHPDWYDGDEDKLTAEVAAALASDPSLASHNRLKLGSLIPIGTPDRRSWLFSLATRGDDGPRTAWGALASGYSELWRNLRGQVLSEVNCPIVGAGFAGGSLSARGTLTYLLLAFHGSSLEGRVTPHLRIVISEKDFDPRMYRAARAMLAELGYSR